MRKIYILILPFIASIAALAQSQRTVLVEEFTNAGCGPCAQYNPAFNALLDANSTKTVAIKYQTVGPGYDVMNVQNPGQVSTRVNLYGASTVPRAVCDGNVFNNSPSNFTQATLDARAAVTSPFTLAISHSFSAAKDSIYVHVVINCTKAVSGNMVAHVGVIERTIYFASAPGSNGETEFEGVMKQMLPSTSGTSLSSSWNIGDSKVFDVKWKLANVYDMNQVAVVSWVQNTSTKEVQQAGYSRSLIPRDAGVTAISGFNPAVCSPNPNALVTLHNFTAFPLTSATINYAIDGGANQTYGWTGNLASDGDEQVALPAMSLSQGKHTISSYSSMPNGGADLDIHNDASKSSTVVVLLTPAASPLVQSFTAALFPPTNWTLLSVGGDASTWIRAGVGYPSGSSAEMYCYTAPAGTVDNLYTPTVDFSTAVAGSAIEFDVAHQQYNANYKERLKVDISSDCGNTWTNVYDLVDPSLASITGYLTTAFAPTSAQWRHEKISLDQFIGQSSVMARFQTTSGNGNNVFLDNVNITNGVVGVKEISNDKIIGLYPNPSTGMVSLHINFEKPTDVYVTVSDLLGKVFQTQSIKSANGVYPLDLTKVSKGIYFVNVKSNNSVLTRRIVISE